MPQQFTVNGQIWMSTMLPTRQSTRLSLCAAFGLTLGAALVSVPVPAFADDENPAWDTKIFRSILEGFGLQRGGNGIVYQERAPLVIPPTATLPPPEVSGAAATNNPAWPNDPDVAKQRTEARLERDRRRTFASDVILKEQRVLSPSELTPGGAPSRNRAPVDDGGYPVSAYGSGSQFDDLGRSRSSSLFSNIFGGGKNETVRFTGEPARSSLTDPPPGYQTPSPNQPYGLSSVTTAPKPFNDMLTRHEAR